jgi:ABC-type nitrate/sulfonate/bicarbonate transport system substrate-binding protein
MPVTPRTRPARRIRFVSAAAAVTAAAALTMAGCSSGGSTAQGASGNGSGTTSAKFAYASTSPLASVIAAEQSGDWTKSGIDVSVDQVPDVGTATTLAIGKKDQFGHSAPSTAFAAMSQGVPITIIAGLGFGTGDAQAGYLTSLGSSGIKTLADLKGKTVAVTAIGSSYDFYLRAALKRIGLNPATDVHIVPVPYPQMQGALQQHTVDAALMLAVDRAQLGAKAPVNVIATTGQLADAPVEITGVVVARNDWLAQNRQTAVDFLTGLVKAEAATEKDVAGNHGAKTIAMLQPILKYNPATMAAYEKYRLDSIGQESQIMGLLRVPESFVTPALATLKSGGGLPGNTPVTYKSAVDLSYLKAAYAKAGIAWNTDVQYP